MNRLYETKYGPAPYKEVLLVNFSIDGIKSNDEMAFLQYNLLMNSEVIQAHLEYSTSKGIAIFVSDTNPEMVLKKTGIKYNIEKKEIIPYGEVLASNNMFVE